MPKNLRLILAASCIAAVGLSGTVPAKAYEEYVSSDVTVTQSNNRVVVCSYSDYKTTVIPEKEKAVAAELGSYSNIAFFTVADRLGIEVDEFHDWVGTDNAELRKPLDEVLDAQGFNNQEKEDLLKALSDVYLAAGATGEEFDAVQRQKIYDDLQTKGNSALGAAELYAEKNKPIEELKAIVKAAEMGQGAKNYVQGIEAYRVILKWTEASNAPVLKALLDCQTKAKELEAQSMPTRGNETSASQTQPGRTQNQKPSEQPGDKKEPTDKGSSKPVIAGIVAAAIAGLIGLIAVAAPMLAKIFPPLAALLNR
ncbi:hypothetical protein CMUST_11135 [Corynebacterium mustelae]|uniref:Uncharacterized protein n=1 Tax=Corynebacterium mustelae TaxID=571915 RepID=A0A0G3H5W3_9CORY|nr:hypothetical protein [Corynebacterium mustelae]AKK06542.1 hypothetical protein CMUST_11135 [Corynebacterium mustelae]